MEIVVQSYWLHKNGSTPDQYEDAFRPGTERRPLDAVVRCAVTDGATEAAFAGLWAKRLAWGYRRGWLDGKETLSARLPTLQKMWRRRIGKMSLSWHAEEKFRQGAYATLAGITFYPPAESEFSRWTAVAIGDSCLFQLRGDALLNAFPLKRAEQFNNFPALLSSNPATNAKALEHTCYLEGTWQAQDQFYLMTDALACWFLKSKEAGEKPWGMIQNMNGFKRTDFQNWIATLRETNSIRNDDTTLMCIRFD